jgi:predicted amidophosphoribosyltransferase
VTSAEAVRGRVILLVDDVFTSGATLNECARTLRRSGARAVYGFVLARALA